MQRTKLYSQISTSLACLSNEKLKQILDDAKPMHEGIGLRFLFFGFANEVLRIVVVRIAG